MTTTAVRLAPNDPAQYDELADEWWNLRGPLAMLHWIAESRSKMVPMATRVNAVLIDLGCGAGLMAPHLADKGYAHIGLDLSLNALDIASSHGVLGSQGDVGELPFADDCADVVSAGEILEHVHDLERVVIEACRVLRPGGLLVLDTIANTKITRIIAVELGERIPGAAPRGIHDYKLFVDRRDLIRMCAENGVDVQLNGLRPSLMSVIRWAVRRAASGRMVTTWSTAVLFQGVGRKMV